VNKNNILRKDKKRVQKLGESTKQLVIVIFSICSIFRQLSFKSVSLNNLV